MQTKFNQIINNHIISKEENDDIYILKNHINNIYTEQIIEYAIFKKHHYLLYNILINHVNYVKIVLHNEIALSYDVGREYKDTIIELMVNDILYTINHDYTYQKLNFILLNLYIILTYENVNIINYYTYFDEDDEIKEGISVTMKLFCYFNEIRKRNLCDKEILQLCIDKLIERDKDNFLKESTLVCKQAYNDVVEWIAKEFDHCKYYNYDVINLIIKTSSDICSLMILINDEYYIIK